ncbi:hypothetical protein [Janthinobacterium sp. AD80]|uniref:hypothetical protein n=1 Tax=unclassified Janthinobacterium TaxID=2610881 RepID=UPI0011AEE659|nr:hypothetical protein [Janthinobacterium sp. AD80]
MLAETATAANGKRFHGRTQSTHRTATLEYLQTLKQIKFLKNTVALLMKVFVSSLTRFLGK